MKRKNFERFSKLPFFFKQAGVATLISHEQLSAASETRKLNSVHRCGGNLVSARRAHARGATRSEIFRNHASSGTPVLIPSRAKRRKPTEWTENGGHEQTANAKNRPVYEPPSLLPRDRSKRRSKRRRGQLHSEPIGNRLNAINVIKPISHPRFFFPTTPGWTTLSHRRARFLHRLSRRPNIGEPAGSTFLRPREKDSADDTKRGRIIKLSVGRRLNPPSLPPFFSCPATVSLKSCGYS